MAVAKTISNGGDKAVARQMAALAQLASSSIGGRLQGRMRNDSDLTNAQVIDHLAEGGRDMRATEEENDDGARLMVATYNERLRTFARGQSKMVGKPITPAMIAADRKMNDSAADARIKMWLLSIREILSGRIESGEDNEGVKTEVTPEYAAQRQRDYGISPSEVFTASGQLKNDVETAVARTVKGKTSLL